MGTHHMKAGFDSALHLYDEAYRQHYEHGNISQACVLYREIIRNFPDSFESVYSVIQLEKIGMREAERQLSRGGWVKPVAIVALILSLVAVILSGMTFFSTFFSINVREKGIYYVDTTLDYEYGITWPKNDIYQLGGCPVKKL